jgi:hypothetical protein
MNQILRALVGSWKRSGKRPAVARSYRPSIESLEERLVLSTSSASIHAVKDLFGESHVFYINKADHKFYMHDVHGYHLLSGAYTVNSFSAGLDRTGHADVFINDGLNHMWEWDSSGWHQLNEPERMTGFAAVKGGRLYAVGADRALWQYTTPYTIVKPIFNITIHIGGWVRLDGPGAVMSIDAVTDAAGRDAVFAIRGDGSFQERFNGAWKKLLADHSIRFGFSAGTDLSGNADVFVLTLGGNALWRYTNSGWTWLDRDDFQTFSQGVTVTLSATDGGQVYFIDNSGRVEKYDALGAWHYLGGVGAPGHSTELSAAASNDVYTVLREDSSGWERTAGVWTQWAPAGVVQ